MTSTIKNVLMIAVLAGVAFGVYFLINNVDFFADATVRVEDVERRTLDIERNIIADLARLDGIDLNGALFTNEAYLSLQNIDEPLPPAFPGRPNPFAPRY